MRVTREQPMQVAMRLERKSYSHDDSAARGIPARQRGEAGQAPEQ